MELNDKQQGLVGKLMLFIVTVIWGSAFFIIKNVMDTVPAFFLLGVRFSLGALVVGLCFIKKLVKLNKKTVIYGFILGLVLFGAYALQTYGLQRTTPGKNAFLTAAYCVIVPFLYWIFFAKRPKINNIAGALLCLGGIGLIAMSDGNFAINSADLLTLAGSFFFALQIVFITRFNQKESCETVNMVFIELVTVSVLCWIAFAIFEKPPTEFGMTQILPLLYLALFNTGLCQVLQALGQRRVSSNSAALILSLEAVFGVLFSVLFYGEKLNLRLGLGFAIIFIAILVSELNWSKIFGRRKIDGGL